jgi:hypothetical protein
VLKLLVVQLDRRATSNDDSGIESDSISHPIGRYPVTMSICILPLSGMSEIHLCLN